MTACFVSLEAFGCRKTRSAPGACARKLRTPDFEKTVDGHVKTAFAAMRTVENVFDAGVLMLSSTWGSHTHRQVFEAC